MARGDWFRNATWNDEIAAEFQRRLARARPFNKHQYLRIQAQYLTESHAAVALALLDQFFELGEDFGLARAHVTKAQALTTLGDIDGALLAYERALEHERVSPWMKAAASLEFAVFVVNHNLVRLYDRALDLLVKDEEPLVFAATAFRRFGAEAIILAYLGYPNDAWRCATAAMAAAAQTHSGFRYHPDVGLVQEQDTPFARRVEAIADTPVSTVRGKWLPRLRALATRIRPQPIATDAPTSAAGDGKRPDNWKTIALREDPAHQARLRERERREEERRARFAAKEEAAAPIVAELVASGLAIESLFDLGKPQFRGSRTAQTILVRWLPLVENGAAKAEIVQALTVPRASREAVAALLAEFRRPTSDDGMRLVIGGAIEVGAGGSSRSRRPPGRARCR